MAYPYYCHECGERQDHQGLCDLCEGWLRGYEDGENNVINTLAIKLKVTPETLRRVLTHKEKTCHAAAGQAPYQETIEAS